MNAVRFLKFVGFDKSAKIYKHSFCFTFTQPDFNANVHQMIKCDFGIISIGESRIFVYLIPKGLLYFSFDYLQIAGFFFTKNVQDFWYRKWLLCHKVLFANRDSQAGKNHVTFTKETPYGFGVVVINKSQSSITTLLWNNALCLVKTSHVTCSIQSEFFISE